MVKVGDSVEATPKIDPTPRRGTVTAVTGARITARRNSGDGTRLIPAAGSLSVVGAARAANTKKSSPKPAALGTATTENRPEKSTAKKPATKKTAKAPAAKKKVKRR